jgi:hypothetical protein
MIIQIRTGEPRLPLSSAAHFLTGLTLLRDGIAAALGEESPEYWRALEAQDPHIFQALRIIGSNPLGDRRVERYLRLRRYSLWRRPEAFDFYAIQGILLRASPLNGGITLRDLAAGSLEARVEEAIRKVARVLFKAVASSNGLISPSDEPVRRNFETVAAMVDDVKRHVEAETARHDGDVIAATGVFTVGARTVAESYNALGAREVVVIPEDDTDIS